MSLNGVWALEVPSVYGWERISTAFWEKGRYLGGNANFYSQGNYKIKGKNVAISLNIIHHSGNATVFGEKQKKFSVEFSGKKKKNMISGHIYLKNAHSSVASYPTRFIRLADIVQK